MSNNPIPVVHLVDDDESLRIALERLLEAAGHEVCSYASAADFLLQRDRTLRGCLVLDVRMPGPGGLELQQAMVRQGEALPLIFLTGHGDIPTSVRAMKAGAFDFLTKPVEGKRFLQVVQAALDEEERRWSTQTRRRELTSRHARLTPAERAVFTLVVEGHPNKRVAAELGCSERTVKAHRARVMTKMRAASLAELVQAAAELDPAASEAK